jgi:mannosyltransferase
VSPVTAREPGTGNQEPGSRSVPGSRFPAPGQYTPPRLVGQVHGKDVFSIVQDTHAPVGTLLGLIVFALVLRSVGLNSGLWVDEIYSVLWSFRGSFGDVLTYYRGDNKHPLYALLANLSAGIFGESSWSVRLPAMLFGVATIPMVYTFGRLVGSKREGLLAAAILTVSYHHVWFSQNARGYSMLAFWTLLTSYLLLRGLREGRPSLWLWYGVAAALGVYTHLTMVFTVVAQALVAGWELIAQARRRERTADWRAVALGFVLSALLTLLFYAPILGQVIEFFTNKPSELKGVSSPGWAAQEAVRVLKLGLGAGFGLGAVVLVGGIVLVAAGVLSYMRQSFTVLLTIGLPAAVTVAGALVTRGTMYPRFFFFLIGFALLIAVRGALELSGTAKQGVRRYFAPVFVGLIVVASLASLPANYRYSKQDFVGAMRFVEASKAAGDRVVSVGVTMEPYQALFRRPWRYVSTAGDLADVRTRGRVWLVYTFPRYVARQTPEIWAVIQEQCTQRRVFRGTVGDGDLVVCTLERAPEPA